MPISYKLYHPPVASSDFVNYVPQLTRMINDAFDSQDRSSYGKDELFPGRVIQHDDNLRDNYGDSGLVAVAFDTEEDVNGVRQIPVALVGLKHWKGKDIDGWKAYMEAASRRPEELESFRASKPHVESEKSSDSVEWGLSFAASKPDPRYRGKGLVARCMAMLEQHLIDLRCSTIQRGSLTNEEPISIWLTALGGIGNVEYYQRRGFVLQVLDDAPAGMWGSTGPFKVATMKKTI